MEVIMNEFSLCHCDIFEYFFICIVSLDSGFTCNLSFKMRQRNMVYTGPMIETEVEHAHLQPEPCLIPYGPLPSGFAFMAAPPGPRVVPLGTHNQLPFPSHQVMDGPHREFKGKITESFHLNFQYSYPAPGSSPFVIPEYRGFDVIPVVMGPVHHRGLRNQIAGPTDLNPGIQFIPMSHVGQPLQVVPGPWLDHQFCGNAPGIPYMQGNYLFRIN